MRPPKATRAAPAIDAARDPQDQRLPDRLSIHVAPECRLQERDALASVRELAAPPHPSRTEAGLSNGHECLDQVVVQRARVIVALADAKKRVDAAVDVVEANSYVAKSFRNPLKDLKTTRDGINLAIADASEGDDDDDDMVHVCITGTIVELADLDKRFDCACMAFGLRLEARHFGPEGRHFAAVAEGVGAARRHIAKAREFLVTARERSALLRQIRNEARS